VGSSRDGERRRRRRTEVRAGKGFFGTMDVRIDM